MTLATAIICGSSFKAFLTSMAHLYWASPEPLVASVMTIPSPSTSSTQNALFGSRALSQSTSAHKPLPVTHAL